MKNDANEKVVNNLFGRLRNLLSHDWIHKMFIVKYFQIPDFNIFSALLLHS